MLFDIIYGILLGICLVIAFVFFIKEYSKQEKLQKQRDEALFNIASNLIEIRKLLEKYDDDNKGDLK